MLVNLAVPYWLWTKKSTTDAPLWSRTTVGRAFSRVLEASGGFPPCPSGELAEILLDLCNESHKKLTPSESTSFERAGSDVVFSCEVTKTEIRLHWKPETGSEKDLDCGPDREEQVAYAPAFAFNYRGQLRTISYNTPDGVRAVAPVVGCRRKLASARKISPVPAGEAEFLNALLKLPDDPKDVLTKNRICLMFDPAEGWNPYREKFDQ